MCKKEQENATREQYRFPRNHERENPLLHQAADSFCIGSRVVYGQALNELCLCVEQGTVLADLVGIASLLGGFQHREDRVVDVQLQDFIALDVLAAGLNARTAGRTG